MFETESISLLLKAVEKMSLGFKDLPDFNNPADLEAIEKALMQTAEKMQDNYPYFHPLYAGQMLKPPHPLARLAYMLSLWINPNNHAIDGGRASSAMEKEAIKEISKMFGFKTHLGHLCSGGTVANLEALWVANSIHKGKKIAASSQSHYTHGRMSAVIGAEFETIAVDAKGKMDMAALEKALQTGAIGTVVATLGTTGAGILDPLDKILALKEKYNFRIHLDAAYGGYFVLAGNLPEESKRIFSSIPQADSIVVDPHKHGLQPYGCGCIIFKDPDVGKFYKHDSPYTYFSSEEMHLGEITLECSRAGATAVALWTTMQMLPPVKSGLFAKDLEKCRDAAIKFFLFLKESANFTPVFEPELDIAVFAPKGKTFSEISALSRKKFAGCAEKNLHIALFEVPAEIAEYYLKDAVKDSETVTCLRCCFMKPEHLDWLEKITAILESV